MSDENKKPHSPPPPPPRPINEESGSYSDRSGKSDSIGNTDNREGEAPPNKK